MTTRAILLTLALLGFPAAAHAVPPVYVTNQGSATVSAFKPDASGALTAIGGPVATGANPSEVALTPDGRFAYVANSTTPGTVSAFAIGADGGLTSLGAPVATGPPIAVRAPLASGLNALTVAEPWFVT